VAKAKVTAAVMTDAERRARLVARHHLGRTAGGPLEVVKSVVAMHTSDPLTPYLATWARVPGFTTGDLDAAIARRELWRLHAMRRTLFLVPSAEAATFHAAASVEVAKAERKRLVGWLAGVMPARRVPGWLAEVEDKVVAALADGVERRTQDLGVVVPELGLEVTLGSGKWTQTAPVGSRLLFLLAMDGRIARTRAAGTWRSSQYLWIDGAAFGAGHPPLGAGAVDAAAARAEVVRRYLASHGPATSVDVRWWTGWGVRQVDAALAACGAEAVTLEAGGAAWVAPGDVAPTAEARGQVALLPSLDPTIMGWKERDFYLGPHARALFDTNGNAGPTVWLDGRVVGGWAHHPERGVVFRALEAVGKRDLGRIAKACAELSAWLGDTPLTPRFRTPLERELAASGA